MSGGRTHPRCFLSSSRAARAPLRAPAGRQTGAAKTPHRQTQRETKPHPPRDSRHSPGLALTCSEDVPWRNPHHPTPPSSNAMLHAWGIFRGFTGGSAARAWRVTSIETAHESGRGQRRAVWSCPPPPVSAEEREDGDLFDQAARYTSALTHCDHGGALQTFYAARVQSEVLVLDLSISIL